jgi:hypothetical protein
MGFVPWVTPSQQQVPQSKSKPSCMLFTLLTLSRHATGLLHGYAHGTAILRPM